jgi:predicted metal-dependent HD superfamily phosphohydrolase
VFDCRHCPLALPPEVVRDLAARYAEPHRAYHTPRHIAEVLRWFDWVADRTGWTHAAEVYLAIAFHDAIYDPLAKDNEARSAALARDSVGASPFTQQLILLTARHGSLSPGAVDADTAAFLDCDMAILGAAPDEFDAYDAAIAIEYRAAPAEMFCAGRGRFLRRLLAEPRIFLSEPFHAELDGRARENLVRAVVRYEPA